MKKTVILYSLFWTFLSCGSLIASGQSTFTVTNDAMPSTKKGYYNWAVYLKGHPASLKDISHVVYTLHPTFKQREQKVTYTQSNIFRYCATGWGEFDLGVKIFFKDKRIKTQTYHLNFRIKRSTNLCK